MNFVEWVEYINGIINGIVWGPPMLILLVGTGIFITIKSKWFQLSEFHLWWDNTSATLLGRKKAPVVHARPALYRKIITLFGKKKDADDAVEGKDNISPFQAVMTAMSATLGTGNIAGVATAIYLGGPGAVFWLWIAAFFGGITKYSEVVLAVKYREMDEKGFYNGGPMYYIANGLGPKFRWLAVFFAFSATLATFGIGNMTQANSIALAINRAVGGVNPDIYVPTIITGIILAILVGLVIIGGIKRIAAVAEKIIPGIAILWSLGCIVFIGMNLSGVSTAFESIFRGAFGLYSAAGGVAGYTIMMAVRRGIARGVFSNEAGLGSAPIAHAATRGKDPVKQGFWAIFEVFWDTIICTCTAVVILTAGFYHNVSGADLIIDSFNSLFTFSGIGFGGIFVAVCILFFAGTTIIGWSYYGERCLGFLTKNNPRALLIYKVIFCGMVIVGAMGGLTLVWDIADTLNGLMALPNLVALILLRKVVIDLTKKYVETGSAIEKEHTSR